LRDLFADYTSKDVVVGVQSRSITAGDHTDDLLWQELDPIPTFPAGGS
jgi:hypothetical protein